jgi:hypothetical protein
MTSPAKDRVLSSAARWRAVAARGAAELGRRLPQWLVLGATSLQGTASFLSTWDDHFDAGAVDRGAVVVRGELG